jgi:hypothetical protein
MIRAYASNLEVGWDEQREQTGYTARHDCGYRDRGLYVPCTRQELIRLIHQWLLLFSRVLNRNYVIK